MVSGSEKHLCECGRRLGSVSHKKHAKHGFVRRKDHDMCERCFEAALNKARHSEHYDPLRPNNSIREVFLPEQAIFTNLYTPEQRLYAALIEIGLNDLGGVYEVDVREWFASHAEHPGSFAHACYVLHMDPDTVREWVLS